MGRWADMRRSSVTDAECLETIASFTLQQDEGAATPAKPAVSAELIASIGTTPSADPELWAAVYASLDEQDARRQRQLQRHLSDASPELAGQLREQRERAERVSPEGICHFSETAAGAAADAPGGCSGDGGGDCGLVLPSFENYPPAVREAVLQQLTNAYLQREAEQEGVINAIPGCTHQLVLQTLGDGNCLSHACSLGVWGVHDRDARLRAILKTMSHPAAGAAIRARFEAQLAANGVPQEGWAAEWQRELSSLPGSSTYLSDVHAFTLANVLRRPVLLFGDEQAAAAGLSGVYLPSLWPSPQAQGSRQPLALLYGWSHFSLLLTVQGEGPASPPLLPLCTLGGPLQLRFLSAEEKAELGGGSGGSGSSDQQLAMLRRYMDAERIYSGGLGVRLSEAPRPSFLVNLLRGVYVRHVAEREAAKAADAGEAHAQAQQQGNGTG